MKSLFENERMFINQLINDDKLFDSEFDKIKEYYPMGDIGSIYDFLKVNPGIIVVLNMVKPLLEENVPYSTFHLRLDDDPIFVPQLLLIVEAPWEKFQNGFKEEIRKIDLEIRPFILEFELGKEFFISRRSLRDY